MKPKQPKHANRLAALTHKVKNLDEHVINELYGLEPVFHPDTVNPSRVEATEFVEIQCPYCGECFETRIDLTGGSFAYVEDCQICCQPIELNVEVSAAGARVKVNAQRLD